MTVSTSTPLFIGYTTLEEWITVVDDDRPVFANLITELGKHGQYDTRTDQLFILAAQADDEFLVHYCRLVVGEMRYLSGDPPDRRPIELAGQAWQIVQDWLKAQGLVVRKGVIAVPENLLMNGWANFLRFDQKKQEYTTTN
jgi:hypothetical protein